MKSYSERKSFFAFGPRETGASAKRSKERGGEVNNVMEGNKCNKVINLLNL